MASPRSVLGGDGDAHRRHKERPVQLLSRLRTLVDEVFVRVVPGVAEEERVTAIRDALGAMLRTPGNPPLPPPAPSEGPLGGFVSAVLDRLARSSGLAADYPETGEGSPLREAVLNESLRLRPSALAALRKLTEPLTVVGRDLAPGTNVVLPLPLLHRDPTFFPEPEVFRPGRAPDGAAATSLAAARADGAPSDDPGSASQPAGAGRAALMPRDPLRGLRGARP